jgi:hypothetical protein
MRSSHRHHILRFADHRREYWYKHFSEMEPTHCLSLVEYHRFGLIYPFEAGNFHFGMHNRFLFTPTGTWIQNDHANPLEAWE